MASSSLVWFQRCLSQFFHNWSQAINLKYVAPHIIMFLLEATAAALSMTGNRNWFICVPCGACQDAKCAVANWGTRFAPDSPRAVPPGPGWNLYSWLSSLSTSFILWISSGSLDSLTDFLIYLKNIYCCFLQFFSSGLLVCLTLFSYLTCQSFILSSFHIWTPLLHFQTCLLAFANLSCTVV